MSLDARLIRWLQEPSCWHCGLDLDQGDDGWAATYDGSTVCRHEEGMIGSHEPFVTDHDFEWVICGRCKGEGTLRGYPGVYTSDDFDSYESLDDYMEYQRSCEDCGGTGKIKTLTEAALQRPEVAEYIADYYETENIYRMERMAGA